MKDPSSLEFDMAAGPLSLVEPDQAQIVSDGRAQVLLARLDGTAAYPLCD
jgi:hypothetical protein